MINEPNLERDAHRLDGQLLSDLWVFRAAGRFHSITGAARWLGVTQGAVSQRVLRLEARLGTPLFVRVKSRITLTPSGELLMKAMTDVAQILNDGLSKVYEDQRGSIVVSCVPSLATEFLVPALHNFYEEHPGIEVFVRSELMATTAERLDDEGVDLAIDYTDLTHEGLHELDAVQEMIFPVCSRAYSEKLARRDPEERIIVLHDDIPSFGAEGRHIEWREWRRVIGEHWPPEPHTDRQFNLAVLAYHAAIGDQGVAMGRSVLAHRLMAKGELIPASRHAPVPGLSYRAVTHRPGGPRSPVRQFALWWGDQVRITQAKTLELLQAHD
jgi:LysR family glycine cleavage system transcriptional activator